MIAICGKQEVRRERLGFEIGIVCIVGYNLEHVQNLIEESDFIFHVQNWSTFYE